MTRTAFTVNNPSVCYWTMLALVLSAFFQGSSAFDVAPPSRNAHTKLNYVDPTSLIGHEELTVAASSTWDHIVTASSSSTSTVDIANHVVPQHPSPEQQQQQPHVWELPVHHYSASDGSKELLDLELQVGRMSMWLGLAMVATEVTTGKSLPELILSNFS